MKEPVTRPRPGEKGAIKIKTALIFVFLAIVVFVLFKIVPVYIEEQKVYHDTDEIARKASLGLYSKDKIQDEIQGRIQDNGLPDGSMTLISAGNNTAQVEVKYSRTIDFIVTTYDWNVDYTATGKAGL